MKHSGPVVILLSLVAACAEGDFAPTSTSLKHTAGDAAQIIEGQQDAPLGLPQEYQVPALLKSVEPDAGWSSDGFAYGGAIVRYIGTHAFAKATVDTDLGSKSHEAQESQQYPIDGELEPDVPIVSMRQCKGIIRGTAYGRVWNETLVRTSVVKWDEQARSASKQYECPRRATTTTTTTPSPDEDGGGTTCYLLEVDHYWYYPSSGDVEYRYTEAYRWCETGGPAYM
jgi:hypothetical protein